MRAAFSRTGASCFLAGQLTAQCTLRALARPGWGPHRPHRGSPGLLQIHPCPSPLVRGGPSPFLRALCPFLHLPGPFPSLPSLPLVVSSCRRNPGNHHSHFLCPQFLQGLTHTQFSLIWSSLVSAHEKPQPSHSFLGAQACQRRWLVFESHN